MHEFAITDGILKTALKGAEEQGASKISAINLKIGAMSDIVSDCLEFYFSELSKGTIAEGALLRIQKINAKAKCGSCGHEFEPDEFLFQCPSCGQFGAEILSGKELEVSSIEIEKDE